MFVHVRFDRINILYAKSLLCSYITLLISRKYSSLVLKLEKSVVTVEVDLTRA